MVIDNIRFYKMSSFRKRNRTSNKKYIFSTHTRFIEKIVVVRDGGIFKVYGRQ